jgi:hypothetical protein
MNRLIEVALFHHSEGRPVIAVNEQKRPYRQGWNDFFSRRQTEDEVRREFTNGAYGIAIILHPACSLGVLDHDGIHAKEAWQSTGIPLPETARNISRSGYDHLIFTMPPNLPELRRAIRLVEAACDCQGSRGNPKPCGVDFLVNGYVVCPPTPGYREDPDHPLESAVELPQAVLNLAIKKQKDEKQRPTGDADGKVNHGKRKATACSLAGSMRIRGMSIESIRAALKADSEARFNPPLEDNEIEDVLKSAASWERGATKELRRLTDLGNAERFVDHHQKDVRYCIQLGWLVWDGRRWAVDNSGEVERRAKLAVRQIYIEAAHTEDKEAREAISSWAHRSESAARITAMIELAKSEYGIPVNQDALDCNPWLLNVANGTLDLKSGALREHSPDDLITKLIDVEYHPDAKCPTWEKFLERVLDGDTDFIQFIQKALGYSLTGSTREQVFFINYGTGQNGKTTLQDTMRELLGDYAKQTSTETLLVKRFDGIPNDVARLAGARFVCAVETESGRRLAEALVKAMTGGDTMSARFLYRETFQFKPSFKLWLAVNHKPRILGTDVAI